MIFTSPQKIFKKFTNQIAAWRVRLVADYFYKIFSKTATKYKCIKLTSIFNSSMICQPAPFDNASSAKESQTHIQLHLPNCFETQHSSSSSKLL
jgi:hypothetical protein